MNIKSVKYFKSNPTLSKADWVEIRLNDSTKVISAFISNIEGESPVWDLVKEKVDAGELTIQEADSE